MPAHARPPEPGNPKKREPLPPNTVEGTIEELGAEAQATLKKASYKKRGRKPRIYLPNDDPFVLIGMVNETGGALADADKKAMNATQMAAFRKLCLMPPGHRSLYRLSTLLSLPPEEGGWGKAPNRKSLEKWSSYWNWQKLLLIYDEALDRYRMFELEQARIETRDRHARSSRAMMEMAAGAIESDLTVQLGPDGQPLPVPLGANGRPQRPANRIQGLAFLYKVGMEGERLALGLPNTITDQKVQADTTNTNVNVTVSVDDWRKQSRLARMTPEEIEREKAQLALPAPAADKPWLKGAQIKPEDVEELPPSWFDSGEQPLARPSSAPSGPVVDADAPVTTVTSE